MSSKEKIKNLVLEKTSGTFRFLADYLLLQVLTGAAIMSSGLTEGYGSRGVSRAIRRSEGGFLRSVGGRGFAPSQVGKSLSNLAQKGYIRYPRRGADPEITAAGIRRLRSQLPIYDSKRRWDGKMYLVTYDVPEERRGKRDLLRSALARIGCGKLQASVWITPHDPRDVLREFVFENQLAGFLVISEVGSRGMVGGEDFAGLVGKVYRLDKLGRRYQSFVGKYRSTSLDLKSVLEFWSVLRDDPQLPFELLPPDWVGHKAYQICAPAIKQFFPNLSYKGHAAACHIK